MLDDIAQILRENCDLTEIGQPQPEDEIARAEQELGVKFPLSFRNYLARWGYISFGPHEYFGLGTSYNNVVQRTLSARERTNLPPLFVMICDRDGDEYVCIDTASDARSVCPILIWDVSNQVVSRDRSIGFDDFLKSDLQNFLE